MKLGIDVVSIERIARVMAEKPRFVEKILTPAERDRPLSPRYVAGRWAAKEAVAKALGTRPAWHDVQILTDPGGGPSAKIAPHKWCFTPLTCSVSITHDAGLAIAVAAVMPGSNSDPAQKLKGS